MGNKKNFPLVIFDYVRTWLNELTMRKVWKRRLTKVLGNSSPKRGRERWKFVALRIGVDGPHLVPQPREKAFEIMKWTAFDTVFVRLNPPDRGKKAIMIHRLWVTPFVRHFSRGKTLPAQPFVSSAKFPSRKHAIFHIPSFHAFAILIFQEKFNFRDFCKVCKSTESISIILIHV